MDKIEKLFRKISKKDREKLITIIRQLTSGKLAGFNIQKIKNSDFYKIRKGNFRIIFHYAGQSKETIIDNVTLRNEGTYKNFKK